MGYHFQNEAVTPKKLNTIGPGPGASAQATPDLTVYVGPGVVNFGGTIVKYAGGNSPSISAPATNPRIDLITIDDSGAIGVVTGSENASPVAPDYPADKAVISEVYMRVGATSIKNADDSTNGYIIRDSRSLYHASDSRIKAHNCYEDITAGDAVAEFTVDNIVTLYAHDQTPTASNYDTEGIPRAQEFTVPLGVTSLKTVTIVTTGSNTPTISVSIRDSLTGSDLANYTSAGQGTKNLDVSGLTFTPGATYYVIVEDVGGAANGMWYGEADGSGRGWVYSGGSWSLSSINHYLRVSYDAVDGAEGDILKASALDVDDWRFNFIGFATETITEGNDCLVEEGKSFAGLTGLTDEADYYLSDTNGAVSTTPGTYERQIGEARGTETMYRHQDGRIISPPLAIGSSGNVKASGLIAFAQNNNPFTMTVREVNTSPRYAGSLLVQRGDAYSTNAGTRYLQIMDVAY